MSLSPPSTEMQPSSSHEDGVAHEQSTALTTNDKSNIVEPTAQVGTGSTENGNATSLVSVITAESMFAEGRREVYLRV